MVSHITLKKKLIGLGVKGVYLPSADLSKCRFTGDSRAALFQTQKGFFGKLVEESLARGVVEKKKKKERNEREKVRTLDSMQLKGGESKYQTRIATVPQTSRPIGIFPSFQMTHQANCLCASIKKQPKGPKSSGWLRDPCRHLSSTE